MQPITLRRINKKEDKERELTNKEDIEKYVDEITEKNVVIGKISFYLQKILKNLLMHREQKYILQRYNISESVGWL